MKSTSRGSCNLVSGVTATSITAGCVNWSAASINIPHLIARQMPCDKPTKADDEGERCKVVNYEVAKVAAKKPYGVTIKVIFGSLSCTMAFKEEEEAGWLED